MWLMASLTDSFNTLKDFAAPERRTSRRILTVKEICLLIQPQLAEVQTGENVCASRETLKKCAIKTISVWVLKAAQCLCQGGHKLQAIKRFSPFNPVNDAWAKPKPSSTNERGSWQPHRAFSSYHGLPLSFCTAFISSPWFVSLTGRSHLVPIQDYCELKFIQAGWEMIWECKAFSTPEEPAGRLQQTAMC